ncbi:MAG: nitric oxide synthase oxygenase [Gemmatimonadota bacterium]
MLAEAQEYLFLMEREGVITAERHGERIREIEASIARSGSYAQQPLELEYGAKLAWRNSARCIGRLYWQKLEVRDLRHLDHADDVFAALVDHLRFASNGGKIRSTISVFAPQESGTRGIRIWNSQLIRYAGYRRPDGTVLGDPIHVEFTKLLERLGWDGGQETPFDLLPIVIQMPGEEPRLYELPQDAVLEVDLEHPEFEWFAELGLKWHAVPVISNMRMEIGGVSYSAAPFNGWYMGTEVGARNLADVDRYDLLPAVARCMGLDTRSNRRLWRDRALVELNVAVLHSFQQAGATVIDHHTAAKHFIRHEEFERQADRPLPAEWSWIVPPVSGSATEVFHREYHDTRLKPNFFPQANAWEEFLPFEPHPRHPVQAQQMDRDGLTGLIHRGALDRALLRFAKHGGVVAVLDVDDFQGLAEKYGQPIGNALLEAAAQTLLGTLRPDDVCARHGSDAFCMLLAGIETRADALAVMERVQRALGRVQLEELPRVGINATIGLTFVDPGSNAASSLQRATEALREARSEGGNTVRLAG